jgi:hydroxyacylglutathione hydrolase
VASNGIAVDILWPALNIGIERTVAELAGDVAAWTAAGDLMTAWLATPGRVDGAVLDVRQASEYAAGHLPQALHIELGDLAARTDEVAGGPTAVMCEDGKRAMTTATLLQRAGHRDVAVLVGGAHDWATVTGQLLREGR